MQHENVLRPWFQKLNHRTVKRENCLLIEQTVRGEVKQIPQSYFFNQKKCR